MKWYYNLKISAKLIIGFSLIAIITGLLGIYAVKNIKMLNDSSTELYKGNTVPINQLADVQADFLSVRTNVRSMLLMKNNFDQYANSIDKSKKEIEDNLVKYEAHGLSVVERTDYDNIKSNLAKYWTIIDKIEGLIKANQLDEAVAFTFGDPVPAISTETEESIKNIVKLNVAEAKLAADENTSQANKSTNIMTELIVLAVFIAIGLGFIISKIISKPIIKIVEIVDSVALGNLDVDFKIESNDEIGSLGQSVKKIIESLKNLISDSNMLSAAAVEGKLSIRANLDNHNGDYKKIVEGVNKTLDAVIMPVKEAASVLQLMANGNLQSRVMGAYKGDHAEIKTALNDTLDSLSSYVKEISAVLEEMSNSNLNVGINNEYKGDFAQIKDALNLIIRSFNEVFGDINNAADQVASGSIQVSDGSQALSQGATEQASSVEELTTSITDIANQTKQNAINANKANGMAMKAKVNAEQGNEHMKGMLKSMEDINESSSNISKIIKVIDDIAFQTNILALNAAVEAARAGQHGKGFAVVAEEVRNLAARSANAAKETTSLIEGSIKKVESGTNIANNTARALVEIVQGVTSAVTLVGEIATASNEQATAISQINIGVEQVSRVIQTNSATAQESAAASEELSSQSQLLKEMIGKFNLKSKASNSSYEDDGFVIQKKLAKRNNSSQREAAATKNKPKIVLSDMEFGKY